MAEIVGVAASAAQLTVTCLSLLDLMKKIKEASSTLKRYHQRLQELRSLSDSVSKNPLLQTPEVGLLTRTILSLIEDNCLSTLLQKSRWLRTWGLLYRERDIIDVFAVLERQKASLSLAIEDIQSRALHQIQNDIRAMAESSSNSCRLSPAQSADHPVDEKDITIFRPAPTDLVPLPSRNIDLEDDDVEEIILPSPKNTITYGSLTMVQPTSDTTPPSHSAQRGPLPKRWANCTAGPNVDQINGPYIELPSGQGRKQKSPPQPISGHSVHTNCKKTGQGVQVNGPDCVRDTGFDYHDIPDFSGEHDGCDHQPGPSDGSDFKATQYNYGRFRRS